MAIKPSSSSGVISYPYGNQNVSLRMFYELPLHHRTVWQEYRNVPVYMNCKHRVLSLDLNIFPLQNQDN